jgi:hypothetical protein
MAYSGSCHCGAVAFTVDTALPDSAISCNCSHCRRKGLLLTFVPAEAFTLDKGEEALGTYRFNTHRIAHRFCTTCGCQPFAEGVGPDGKDMRSINLRCVPAADLDALKIQHFDGASR